MSVHTYFRMGFIWFVCNATAMYVNITHYTDLWFEDHTHLRTYSINELGKWICVNVHSQMSSISKVTKPPLSQSNYYNLLNVDTQVTVSSLLR